MKPISQERVDWITDRIKVLHDMNLELLRAPQKWPQSNPQTRHIALDNIRAEKLQLEVEYEILKDNVTS